MFDFALSELLLVGVIALIVLGPERLPKAARMAGSLVGKLQRLVSNVKQELSAQVELDELRKAKQEFESAAIQFKDELQETSNGIKNNLNEVSDGLKPWERLPEQRTPADFGLDETGTHLPQSENLVRFDENGQPIAAITDELTNTSVNEVHFSPSKEQVWQNYPPLSQPSHSQSNYRETIPPIFSRLHTASLNKQAMRRKRDLRPKYRAKPQLPVRKK